MKIIKPKFTFSDFLQNYNVYVKQSLGNDHVGFTDYSVSGVTVDVTGVTLLSEVTLTS